MKNFKQLREQIKASSSIGTHPAIYPGDVLKQEDSWLAKGFALGQGLLHSSNKQDLNLIITRIVSSCQNGKHEDDQSKKNDLLFDALENVAHAFQQIAELSTYNINVSIAASLLSEDIKNIVSSELHKISLLKR